MATTSKFDVRVAQAVPRRGTAIFVSRPSFSRLLHASLILIFILHRHPTKPGQLTALAELARLSGLSKNYVQRALWLLRRHRVLWLRFALDAVEIRFQPDVVARLLTAGDDLQRYQKLLTRHRRERERVAPYPRLRRGKP